MPSSVVVAPQYSWAVLQTPCIWFCGLSGAGKSTIASSLHQRLTQSGHASFVLDGDNLRSGLCADLGFSPAHRRENLRRTCEVAKILSATGQIPIVACISPFESDRQAARHFFPEKCFVLVFVDTPLEECERRDPKGLYVRARQGTLKEFTGLTSPFEVPVWAEVHVRDQSPEEAAYAVLQTEILRRWMAASCR